MRINRYLAQATGISRRAADEAVNSKRVRINGVVAAMGQKVSSDDTVTFDSALVSLPVEIITIGLNKPTGFVTSRTGQGSKTIYTLLPANLHSLKPVGRLDKDSSGLLIMTNDGKLAQQLSHPSFAKEKVYEVSLDKDLADKDKQEIEKGVVLEDGLSQLKLSGSGKDWLVAMHEGRNRQVRRTLAALGYKVVKLHRIKFGKYSIETIPTGQYKNLT